MVPPTSMCTGAVFAGARRGAERRRHAHRRRYRARRNAQNPKTKFQKKADSNA